MVGVPAPRDRPADTEFRVVGSRLRGGRQLAQSTVGV